MALVLKDRVRETSTTTGTGSFTLGGTSTGFQSFSVIGDGNTTYYGIVNSAAGEWEVGVGTYTASGTVLSRDTILESSNGGSAVDFSAGTKDVFVTYPAERSASTDTFASPPAIGSTTPAAGTFTTLTASALTATGQTSLGGAAGSEAFRAVFTSGSTARLQATGGIVSGGTGTVELAGISNGSDVVNINYATGQIGNHAFKTGAGKLTQFNVTGVSSAVNYVQVTGAATGSAPTISAQGSDTNAALRLNSKGSGPVDLASNGNPYALQVQGVASGANYNNWRMTSGAGGAAANSTPVVSTWGIDTNISMALQPKGTGAIDLAAGSRGVNISNGGTVTAITRTAGGTGYATAPTVAISAPTTAGGVQATATVAVSAGAITTFTITNAGSGYVEQPTVSFSGGGGSGAAAYARVGSASSIKLIGGSLDFVTPSGTALNISDGSLATGGYVSFTNNSSSNAINRASGNGSNIGISWLSKGTGSHNFATNNSSGTQQFSVAHTASAVNYVQVTGAATGASPVISAQGSDGNASLVFTSKGAIGSIRFATNNSSSNEQFRVTHVASAVNYGTVTGAAAGSAPVYSVAGSDTNIDLTLTPKGTGTVVANGPFTATGQTSLGGAADSESLRVLVPSTVGGAYETVQAGSNYIEHRFSGSQSNISLRTISRGTGSISFYTNNTASNLQFNVSHTSSAVNYVQVTGSATGLGPQLSFTGSDSNVGANVILKGTGSISVFNGAGTSSRLFRATSASSSSVNYLQLESNTATNAPILSAQGSDTNIDLTLTPKGTGAVNISSGGLKFPDATTQTTAAASLVGSVIFYAANSAPTGYLKANGAAISRTTYAALFAVIGTTFGAGDGSTTFNVPDMRGYFPRGWVDNGTVDSGRAFGSTQTDAMQGHKHNFTAMAGSANLGAGGGGNVYSGTTTATTTPTTDGTNGTPRTASETRPANLALLACIKY